MKIKKMLEVIIDKGKTEDMYKLNDMLDELICDLKEKQPKLYKEYKMKLMGMAYDYKFDEDMAIEIVNNMKPLGEYWDYETTSKVKRDYDINATDCDFYVVMNSLVNDYNKIIDKEDAETYVKMANAFINDDDAKKDKIWIYFTKIPKED
jgi:hypothetical protein|nr:MAG TPA: hypothetical protein [Caudoviricetes sp.]